MTCNISTPPIHLYLLPFYTTEPQLDEIEEGWFSFRVAATPRGTLTSLEHPLTSSLPPAPCHPPIPQPLNHSRRPRSRARGQGKTG